MPAPTLQQLAAIDARGTSVVLSSGAGCGKTFVLTNRYLSHLKLDGVSVSQIVAITFTDRAAREMRKRIRESIVREQLASPKDPSWARHLRGLETAPIQTIHSFCGDLLRQFAVQAGLDPRFEVLEEILADNLRAEALRDTLQGLLTADSPVGNDLCELVVIYGWTAVVNAVRELLLERDTIAWTSWLDQSPADIAAKWLESERKELLPKWVDYLCAAAPKIAHLVNLFRNTECIGPEMQANVRKVLDGLPKLTQAADLAVAVKGLREAAKVGKEKAKAWPSEEAYQAVKKAMEEFREDLPAKLSLFTEEPEGVDQAAAVGQRFIRVALAVADAYQQRKQRAGVLDFQDLLVLARDLVKNLDEVKRSLQARYRYLLLDEMQDTDPVQMELVELLCGIGLQHDKLFAVGDAKQSIYRFRGADVELFEKLRDGVSKTGQLSLTRNYRSQPEVLHFINALCSLRFPNYEPLEAHHERRYDGACVEFLWSVPTEGSEKESASEIRIREADTIARRIVDLITSQEPRILENGKLRSVKPGNVVLLFRSMSNVAVYESALRKHGLDYYLVGGRAFFAQQEIYDLLNLLRTLENPDDSLALAGTLRSPFGCLSDDALLLVGLHPNGLWAGLHDDATIARLPDDQRPRAERIRMLLSKWRESKDRLPIARLMGLAFADSGYDAAMQFEFLGDRKLANLWKLIDLAREFDRSGLFGLADFIARLGDLVTNQPREEQAATQPENADVIKIMSIHQAKGLEFPVVFIPDFAAGSKGGIKPAAHWDRMLGCLTRPTDEDPPLFTDFPYRLGLARETVSDWREDLRILYVACTRARDLLILSAGLKEPFPPSSRPDQPVPVKAPNAWMLALSERFHLLNGECLDATIPMEKRPRVKVVVVEPAVGKPVTLKRRKEESIPDFVAADIVPIPPMPWPAIVSLAELENRERRSRQEVSTSLTPGPSPAEARGEGSKKFEASEWPARLQTADKLLREVEFLTPWPVTGEERPAIHGTIDYLWKDADGWHLLTLVDNTRPIAGRVLEAWVINEQYGNQAVSVNVFDLRTGKTTTLTTLLDFQAAWAELEEMLRSVSRPSSAS
jgi:ATP-dependent helicase/nuclease subunit A